MKHDTKEMTMQAIGQRMGRAMAMACKFLSETEYRGPIVESLGDIPILLSELKKMNIPADVYGHLTIENETLKEEVRILRNAVEEKRYEDKLREYSSVDTSGLPYCGA